MIDRYGDLQDKFEALKIEWAQNYWEAQGFDEGRIASCSNVFYNKNTYHCGKEGGNCACEGVVRFGREGRDSFVQRDTTGEISCSTDYFGDPLPGTPKECTCKTDEKAANRAKERIRKEEEARKALEEARRIAEELEKQRIAAEKAAAEERARLEAELERQRLEAEEAERLAREKAKREREQAERERLAAIEQARIEAEEAAKEAARKAEWERLQAIEVAMMGNVMLTNPIQYNTYAGYQAYFAIDNDANSVSVSGMSGGGEYWTAEFDRPALVKEVRIRSASEKQLAGYLAGAKVEILDMDGHKQSCGTVDAMSTTPGTWYVVECVAKGQLADAVKVKITGSKEYLAMSKV